MINVTDFFPSVSFHKAIRLWMPVATLLLLNQIGSAADKKVRNDDASKYQVVSVEWVGYDPGDGKTNYEDNYAGNAAYGGGDRIFAERNQPQGRKNALNQAIDHLHDKIRIKVTLNNAPPTNKNVTVYLRVLDPDHYSTDADFDPDGDDTVGGDNVLAGGSRTSSSGSILKKADFSTSVSSVTITGNGTNKEALAGLEIIARQPCNNFRVVAHVSEDYINEVKIGTDGKTLKQKTTTGSNVPAGNQTRLLTVWRTLYVERDSMEAPVYTQGPAPSRIMTGNVVGVAGNTITTDVDIYNTGCTDQFQNGKIELQKADNTSLGIKNVAGNDTAPQSNVTLTVSTPADAAKFRNLEDDDVSHAVGAADMQIDASLWESRFKPACVKVDLTKTDLSPNNADSVNQTNVTFETNLGTSDSQIDEATISKAKIKANKQGVSTADFWVIYQLGAFQGRVDLDNDPDTELSGSGLTLKGTSGDFAPADDKEAGSLIFAEVCKDQSVLNQAHLSFANWKKVVSVHEAAHSFDLDDGPSDGSLFVYTTIFNATTQADMDALTISGTGLKKIISKNFPGR